jgi:hypothetical protein
MSKLIGTRSSTFARIRTILCNRCTLLWTNGGKRLCWRLRTVAHCSAVVPFERQRMMPQPTRRLPCRWFGTGRSPFKLDRWLREQVEIDLGPTLAPFAPAGLRALPFPCAAKLRDQQAPNVLIALRGIEFSLRSPFDLMVDRRSYSSWLGFLNTVRTERFEQVLALRPSLLAIATAAQG